jgi:glycosyltransferase 2 family protein
MRGTPIDTPSSPAVTPPTGERSSQSRAITTVVALVLAAVLLYFSVRGIEWSRVWVLIRGASMPKLGLWAALWSVALFLRAIRWRILLRVEGPVGLGDAFWATSAGYFGNTFLPARAGELVRTFMISARCGLSKTYVLTTALSERMADAIALAGIGALALLALPAAPGWMASAARPAAALGVCGVAAIAFLPRLEPLGQRLLRWVPLPTALRSRLLEMLEHAIRGIRAFHDAGRLLLFLGLTIVIWCVNAAGTVAGASALGLSIPVPLAFLLNVGLGLGTALPSTPGYVGIYQFVAVSVLVPFGFGKTDVIAYTLVTQALFYPVVGFWGALAFWRRPAKR